MKHSLNIGIEPNFQKIIITSAVLHLFFLALATVPFKTKEREYKSYYVNIVTPAEVRKPKASLKSKKTGKAESESIKVKTPIKRRTKPKPKSTSKADMTLEPDKKVAQEIERLRAITSLAKMKKKKEEGKSGKLASIRKKIQGSLSKKDTVTQETPLRTAGIPGIVNSTDTESYSALVFERIQREWIYPDFDIAKLETIISFKITKEGNVLSQKIIKSSGNAIFDRSAMKAVLKASPLPPPPVEQEVEVRFHL
jgi:colicin import membrane protein